MVSRIRITDAPSMLADLLPSAERVSVQEQERNITMMTIAQNNMSKTPA